ncbi:hypothetical protein NMB96_05015 [Xanthomonas hortorum]|uniref:hypothetical protein n=1 Tax=Xanthomonas hortorum TaxID=56454 RepID=UPI0020CD8483|nr:hypothetical protein [Xanthomonas hortorum]UTS74205.1 hypothetical protein NMB96_05015 [Xanthomonas hortorum]
MSRPHQVVRVLLLLVTAYMAAGCHRQPQQTSAPQPDRNSDSQTAVPLARSLEAIHDGEIRLDFDVPATNGESPRSVFIGVRLEGRDSTSVAEAADALRKAKISAKVQLYQIEQGRTAEVELKRSHWVSRNEVEWLTIPADGAVPGLEAADADRESLLEAGLIAQGVAYTELSFASADALPSGHYILGLALGNERQLLIDAKAKLLIAYRAKKK